MADPSTEPVKIAVADPSQVGVARDAALRVARRQGLTPARADVVALVTTELAENLHRHATGGELLISLPAPGVRRRRFAVTAVDRGPGVAGFARCLVDGYSTRGTMGTGLGAAVRLADEFDAVSEPGLGTIVRAAFSIDTAIDIDTATDSDTGIDSGARDIDGFDVAAVGFPVEPELVNGDGWSSARRGDRIALLLADGLGHGPGAHEASRTAVAAFDASADRSPGELMRVVSDTIAGTRGAAVSVATLDLGSAVGGGTVTTSGLGNVSIAVVDPDGTIKRLATSHGTAGAARGIRTRELTHDFPAGGVLILHTDGLTSRWTLTGRAELLRHGAGVIAAALWRDHARGRDDSLVVVVKAVGRR